MDGAIIGGWRPRRRRYCRCYVREWSMKGFGIGDVIVWLATLDLVRKSSFYFATGGVIFS
jgi:hypothetical protein